MFTVYSLQSISHPDKFYIGSTENLIERIAVHNEGKCVHTSKYKPWRLMVSIQFPDKSKGLAFECYLKSGSGRGLYKKTLLTV